MIFLVSHEFLQTLRRVMGSPMNSTEQWSNGAATPVKWTYCGIYRVGDAQVGVWSNPVSVTVGG